jgi:DNA-directed RNA polymerase subunit beta'
MAIELFQPFIIRELINQGLASNMKIAKNLIQQNETIIDPVLEKVLKVIPFSKPSAYITQIRDSSI